jgi:hypothetical protein
MERIVSHLDVTDRHAAAQHRRAELRPRRFDGQLVGGEVGL